MRDWTRQRNATSWPPCASSQSEESPTGINKISYHSYQSPSFSVTVHYKVKSLKWQRERGSSQRDNYLLISASVQLTDVLLLLLAEMKEQGKRWHRTLRGEPVCDQSMVFSSSGRFMKGKTCKWETVSFCPLRCMHGVARNVNSISAQPGVSIQSGDPRLRLAFHLWTVQPDWDATEEPADAHLIGPGVGPNSWFSGRSTFQSGARIN